MGEYNGNWEWKLLTFFIGFVLFLARLRARLIFRIFTEDFGFDGLVLFLILQIVGIVFEDVYGD